MLDLWGVAEPDDRTADARLRGFSDFKFGFGGTLLDIPGPSYSAPSSGWTLS